MPIYEYQCDSCKNEFELLVRGSELPECPSCSGNSLTKKLSVAAAPKSGGSLPISNAQPSNLGAG